MQLLLRALAAQYKYAIFQWWTSSGLTTLSHGHLAIVIAKYCKMCMMAPTREGTTIFSMCRITHGILQVNSPFLVQSLAMQGLVQSLAAQYWYATLSLTEINCFDDLVTWYFSLGPIGNPMHSVVIAKYRKGTTHSSHRANWHMAFCKETLHALSPYLVKSFAMQELVHSFAAPSCQQWQWRRCASTVIVKSLSMQYLQ
jgi:hypothetical protein